MVESAYTGASKASARKGLRVRVPLPAPLRRGVLAERARRVGVHAGRGAEPPGTPAFRHVAGRAVPAWGPEPRTSSLYMRCRSGAPGPRHRVHAVPGRAPGPRHHTCAAGPSPLDLGTARAVPGRAPGPRHRACGAGPSRPDLVAGRAVSVGEPVGGE